MKKYNLLISALALAALLLACSLTPASTPTPISEIPPTIPVEPAPEEIAPTETLPPSFTDLPAALYLLGAGNNGLTQVFRISQDRSTTTQMTEEPENVDGYAVNPVTGQVAYLSNNQIYLINADTTGRTLLVDGSDYIAETDDYFFRLKISGLSFSGDGATLAYGQNGLNLLNLADNTSQKVIENELDEQNGFIFPRALYTPLNWSPDGSLMMVDIGFYEGGTIGIFSPATGEVTRLGEGIVCCHPTWSTDSRSVVLASPYLGMVASGLWRYDVQTGAGQELIPTALGENHFNFAGWPLVLPDNTLQFFYGSTAEYPSGDVPLAMVRSNADGVTNRTIIRIEEWQNYDVLWSPDGRLAVAVMPQPGEAPGWPRIGPVVLIPASADAVVPLGINGYDLQWGP